MTQLTSFFEQSIYYPWDGLAIRGENGELFYHGLQSRTTDGKLALNCVQIATIPVRKTRESNRRIVSDTGDQREVSVFLKNP